MRRNALTSVPASRARLPSMRNRVKPSLTAAPVREVTNHGGFGSTEPFDRLRVRTIRDRARERPERPAHDGALDAVEQQRVVHDADAARHVVERAAGERAPRARSG